MKKLFFGLLIVGYGSYFQSCVSDNSHDTQVNSQKSALVSDLSDFNNDLMASVENETSRGFWSSLLKVCAVVGADALGAYEGGKIGGAIGCIGGPIGGVVGAGVGGLVCGAGASYLAYDQCYGTRNGSAGFSYSVTDVYEDPFIFERITSDLTLSDIIDYKETIDIAMALPEQYFALEEIAIKHNIALDRLANGYLLDDSEILDEGYRVINTPEFISEYQNMLDNILLSFDELGAIDIEKYMCNVDSSAYSPITVSVLELFMDIYTKYPSRMDDIDFIVNYYINKIEQTTELTAADKEQIYSALAVAAYSPRLWEPIMNQ